jgi:hypothetical protein
VVAGKCHDELVKRFKKAIGAILSEFVVFVKYLFKIMTADG